MNVSFTLKNEKTLSNRIKFSERLKITLIVKHIYIEGKGETGKKDLAIEELFRNNLF